MKRFILLLFALLHAEVLHAQAVIEKPIVVIIPSYNNHDWYKKNLDSALCQKYSNYHVLYINDCSSDDTGKLVQEYIKRFDTHGRITLIHNATRRGALANLYHAIHACDDHSIIVTLDGDDWFKTDQVLTRINQEYQDSNVWFTYGQFVEYPNNKPGFCREMPASIIHGNLFREYDWITTHLRTFYAALFKQVKLKDLLYEGHFFTVTGDMAYMYPILEMSAGHFRCIPDVLYVYNQANTLNDFRRKTAQQIRCKYYVQSKEKYTSIPSFIDTQDESVAIIIFSDDAPEQLLTVLDNLQTYIYPIDEIKVLYRSHNATNCARYKALKDLFITVDFIPAKSDFKKTVIDTLHNTHSNYLLLTDTSRLLQEPCDLKKCINILHQTKAHAFYLALSQDSDKNIPPMVPLDSHCVAWQFKYAEFAFKQVFSTHLVLYAKDTIQKRIERVTCSNVEQLMQQLNSMQFDYENVGLCFKHAKIKGQ